MDEIEKGYSPEPEEMVQKEKTYTRRRFFRDTALAVVAALKMPKIESSKQLEIKRKHAGEIPPLANLNYIYIDDAHSPTSPENYSSLEEEATAEIDFRKFNFFVPDNPKLKDGTAVKLPNIILPLLKQVQYGDTKQWFPHPDDNAGWIYNDVEGLYRPDDGSPDWSPPHNRDWKVDPKHWPPTDDFITSPAVINIHNFAWNLDPSRPDAKNTAFLRSIYDLQKMAFESLNNGNPGQAQAYAERNAGKFFLFSAFKPGGAEGPVGDTTAPYVECVIVDKQIIPLGQENDILQLSGFVKDEDGNTLYAVVSCYPLEQTQGETTTMRYVQWFKTKKINF